MTWAVIANEMEMEWNGNFTFMAGRLEMSFGANVNLRYGNCNGINF
jgi:hypothetical protein